MKISREARIGISSIVIMFIAYWGITFLKGANILSSTNIYTTSYSNVDGLEMSSPVTINGMKVGTVIRVEMGDVSGDVVVDFTVKSKYHVPSNSVAVLGGQSLLGGKELIIKVGDSKTMLKGGERIASSIDNGMMDAATDIAERASNLIDSLTLSLSKINGLMSEQLINNVQNTVSNLNSSTSTLDKMLSAERGRIATITTNLGKLTGDINGMMPELRGTITNANNLADSLNNTLPALISQIEQMVAKINSENGTIGKLLNDTKLYDNATLTLEEAAALLKDLKENPKKYVHFSLFGKKSKVVQAAPVAQ